MSSFICESCGKHIIDTDQGYISECEHYPLNKRSKPMSNKWEFFIAGVQFHQAKTVINELEEGTELELIPDPENKYDPNAVEILYCSIESNVPTMLGFVPKKFSPEVAAFLEIAESPICVITALDPKAKPWEQIKVVIKEAEIEEEAA